MKNTKIQCPKCEHNFTIEVESLLHHQLQEEYDQKFKALLKEQSSKFSEQEEQLRSEREELTRSKSELQEAVQRSVQQRLNEERSKFNFSRRIATSLKVIGNSWNKSPTN